MTRLSWMVLVLLSTVAASPSPSLPVPPIPPLHPPIDQSAPLPDRDAAAPAQDPSQGPSVMLRDFRVNGFSQGMGYTPGSQFEASEEKRPIQTPGVTLRFPLQ